MDLDIVPCLYLDQWMMLIMFLRLFELEGVFLDDFLRIRSHGIHLH